MRELRHIGVAGTRRFEKGKEGFALIITLTLMAFVVLLLVSLVTFSRVETAAAGNQLRRNQARENARFALHIALAELQRTAGEDSRITAQARLIDPDFLDPSATGLNAFATDSDYHPNPNGSNLRGSFEHPFWTGVWNPASSTGDQPNQWHWLVSGNENLATPNLQPNDGLPDLGGSPGDWDGDFHTSGDWVRLVGPGSVVRPPQEEIDEGYAPDPYVYVRAQGLYAQMPGFPNGQQTIGRYAYWVGDEGVKANLGWAGDKSVVPVDADDTEKEERYRQTPALESSTATRYGLEYFSDRTATNRNAWEEVNVGHEGLDRILMLRQIDAVDPIEWEDDIKPLFHGVTTHSRGVLANTDPNAQSQFRGLKRDLTRNPDDSDLPPEIRESLPDFLEYGRWFETDYFISSLSDKPYNPPGSVQYMDPDDDNATREADFRYPLRYYENDDDGRPFLRPIIKNFRIRGEVSVPDVNQPFEIRLFPELELWNPYTTDITYFSGNQKGYRIMMRLTYLESETSVPFILRVGAGIHWRNTDPVLGEPTDEYVSWLPTGASHGLDFFNTSQSGSPTTLPNGDPYIEFELDSSLPDIRLRAGDSYILTGEPLQFGPTTLGATAGSRELSWQTPVHFSPRTAAHPSPKWDLDATLGTLYVELPSSTSGVADLAPFELSVYMVPWNDSRTNENDYVIFRRRITPSQIGILGDPGPNGREIVNEDFETDPNASYLADFTTWDKDWREAQPGVYQGLDWAAGDSAPFMIGFQLTNPISTGTDPRDPGAGTVLDFYRNDYVNPSGINSLRAWGQGLLASPSLAGGTSYSEDRFGETGFTDLQPNTLSVWDRRGIVLFDLPGDLSLNSFQVAGDPDRWPGVVTSIGQLQHLHLEGEPPFLIGGPGGPSTSWNERLWDGYYFSGAFSTAVSSAPHDFDPNNLSEIKFMNPRISLHPGGLDPTDIARNLEEVNSSTDRAAANLMVEGSFNVNSTSVAAWTLLLHNEFQEDLSYLYSAPGDLDFSDEVYYGSLDFFRRLEELEEGSNIPNDIDFLRVPYPRFSFNPGLTLFGRLPYDNGLTGTDADGIGNVRSIWRNGYRELYPLDLESPIDPNGGFHERRYITPVNPMKHLNVSYLNGRGIIAEEMARVIVAEIRNWVEDNNRPFRTVAEFVNSGILETAIDTVRWEDSYNPGETVEPNSSAIQYNGLNRVYDHDALDWNTQIPNASPSHLTQRDILARIGPYLTVRSDTFIIRTYGEVTNPVTGEVDAVAYGEAVVQRFPQPWDPQQDPIDPQNGRKFEIVSFRWLSPDEI